MFQQRSVGELQSEIPEKDALGKEEGGVSVRIVGPIMRPESSFPKTAVVTICVAFCTTTIAPVAAEVIAGVESDTGRLHWSWREQEISFQFVQLLPDQTRAFFLGRGFPREDADLIAETCVFQTIARNDGQRPLDYDLSDWSVRVGEQRQGVRTREVWERVWEERGAEQAPRIAFHWSLLPTVQRFEPGDYNWGMVSFGVAPGTRFDLALSISVDGDPLAAEIPGILCPGDH